MRGLTARTVFKSLVLSAIFAFLGAALATLAINWGMVTATQKYVYADIDTLPPRTAVLVLGSQTHGTKLSPVLQDRVDAGVSILEKGRGKKLLLSGDHGQKYYDEVTAMRLYVLKNAIEIREEDIFVDYAGFNTWESMNRAKNVFKVKDLVIVTQQFHISRAVCMARSLGMDAVGYGINQDRYAGKSITGYR